MDVNYSDILKMYQKLNHQQSLWMAYPESLNLLWAGIQYQNMVIKTWAEDYYDKYNNDKVNLTTTQTKVNNL